MKFPLRFALCLLLLAGCKPPQSSENEIHTHALAFSALLAQANDLPLTELKGHAAKGFEQQLLAEWWDVHSREELLSLLQKMVSGQSGHRAFFQSLRTQLRKTPPEFYWGVVNNEMTDRNQRERILLVMTYFHAPDRRVPELTAWDFGRYINLCRWGYSAGYLNESETWERILPVARLLQASFSSWEEYAADYLLGRQFWAAQEMRNEGRSLRSAVQKYLQPPAGVWAMIPWDQSLGEGPIAVDRVAETLAAARK